MSGKNVELLTMRSDPDAEQPFDYSVGLEGSVFFTELQERGRLMGIKCPQCAKVYIPPRKVCGPCFKEMKEFVEVGPEGIIDTYTILRFKFLDPETGKAKPIPYGYGFIKLDGASTNFQHYIEIKDESKIRIGARVRAVLREKRNGTISDIIHFEVIE